MENKTKFSFVRKLGLLLFLIFFSTLSTAQVKIGTTNYTTLWAAFNAINAGTYANQNVVIELTGNVNETNITQLNATASYLSITIKPTGGGNRSLLLSYGTVNTLRFIGAHDLTIDGNPDGSTQLTIAATVAGMATLDFTGCKNVTVRNCFLSGSGGLGFSQNGIIRIVSDVFNGWGKNYTVKDCVFGPYDSNLPTACILGFGTTDNGFFLTNVSVEGNEFHDFASPTAGTTASAIDLSYAQDLKIKNNRIYQTLQHTSNDVRAINLTDINSGETSEVTGNEIGSANRLGTGTTLESCKHYAGIYYSSYLNNTYAQMKIEGNAIRNISVTTSGVNYSIDGIYLDNASALINNNIIGSQTADSFKVTCTNTESGEMYGIQVADASNSTVTNNTIGGMRAVSDGWVNMGGIGLGTQATNYDMTTCTGNTVGGTSANSIVNESYDIQSKVTGILIKNKYGLVNSNTVRNISGYGSGSFTNTVAGISREKTVNFTNGLEGLDITGNTVYGLMYGNGDSPGKVVGIVQVLNLSDFPAIRENLVYGLTSLSVDPESQMIGIYSTGAPTRMANNMVSLPGITATNSEITGIKVDQSVSDDFFRGRIFKYNSVYIGGINDGLGSSSAYNLTGNVYEQHVLYNNIFVNQRTNQNPASTAGHYSIKTLPQYYNISQFRATVYYGTGAGYALGYSGGPKFTLLQWNKPGLDFGYIANPQYINPAATPPNLHINPSVPSIVESHAEIVASTFTVFTDFDGEQRGDPDDIGADVGSFTALPAPAITAVSATAVCTGSQIQVTGTGLSQVTEAKIGATVMTISSISDTSLTIDTGNIALSGTLTLTNPIGSATYPTPINIYAPPVITQQPTSVMLCSNSPASFSVSADGANSYQWRRNGLAIDDTAPYSGTHTATLNITNGASVYGNYDVVITGPAGACTTISSVAVLGLNAAPVPTIGANGPTTICQGDSVTLSTNYNGPAIQFSGSNNYLDFARHISGDFTVEYWMKTTQTGTTGSVWYQGKGIVDAKANVVLAGQSDFGTSLLGNKLAFGVGGFDEFGAYIPVTLQSTSSVNTGQWIHVAVTRQESTGELKLYINGALEASAIDTNGSSIIHGNIVTPNLRIGGMQTGGAFFNGALDNVRVWPSVRTIAQIQSGMSHEYPAVVTAGLSDNFTFNENTGNTTVNQATGQTLTFVGTPGWTNRSTVSNYAAYLWSNGETTPTIHATSTGNYSVTVTDVDGCTGVSPVIAISQNPAPVPVVNASGPTTICQGDSVTLSTDYNGPAVQFSGSNNYLNFARHISGDFTIEYWMKTTQTGTAGSIWYQGKGIVDAKANTVLAGQSDFGTSLLGNKLAFGVGGNDEFGAYIPVTLQSTSSVNTGQWIHVAVTRQESTGELKLYINGALEASAIDTNGSSIIHGNIVTPNLRIGGMQTGGAFFNGALDNVRVWPSVRSIAQIQSGMSHEYPANTAGIADNFTFNENTGNMTVNQATAQTLTFVGTPSWTSRSTVSNYAAYLWSNGETTPTIDATSTGNYSVTVTGADGCQGISNAVPVNVQSVSISVSASQLFITPGGSATLNASGGSDYTWSPATGLDSTSGATVIATPTQTTTYTVTSSGCAGSSKTITITVLPEHSAGDNALDFDGADDYVSIPEQAGAVTGSFTVEAWVKPTDPTKAMHIFSSRNNGEFSFDIQINSGNNIHGDIGDGSQWLTTSADAVFNYPVNAWTHIAYVVTPTDYKIYANGNLAGSGTISGMPMLYGGSRFITIGMNTGEDKFFQGTMDDIRMYGTALTQTQIQSDAGGSYQTSGLIAYYDCNEGVPGGNNTGIDILAEQNAAGTFHGTLHTFTLSGNTSNWVEGQAAELAQAIDFEPLADVVYGSSDFNLTATATSGLQVSYSSSDPGVASVSGNTVTIHGAGSTVITATQNGNAVYAAGAPVSHTLNVTPKTLTISNIVVLDKVYDRNTSATLDGTLDGIVGTDDVNLIFSAAFASFNVNDDIPVTANATLDGAQSGNYSLVQPTGLSADITAKTLTISNAAANDKPYDGTTAATISGSLSGVISPDDVSIASNTGIFASAGVGNDIPVTSQMILGGASANNYSLEQPTGLSADITQIALTATFMGTTAICSGQSTSLALTIMGAAGPFTVQYSDGSQTYTVNNYVSGSNIPVTPIATVVYTLVSVGDANSGADVTGIMPVTVTVLPNAIYYADTDHDGYGDALVSQMSCTGAPLGYVPDPTDCDDTRNTVHPNAVEIGYNGIDDDCDGFVDEGFPPKSTVVQAAQCNTVLAAIDTPVVANLVGGVQGYRWKITTLSGPSAGQVQTIDTALRTMKLTQLVNYAFGTQYKVEVAVLYAGFWQPFTASSCTMTTPSPVTELTACGQTLTSLANVVYANNVPFASGYRFRISDPVNIANLQVLERNVREFRMNLITNFTVQYGKSYNVQVSVKNTDGTWLDYGPVCNVTTPSFPTTSLQELQCDNFQVLSNSTQIYATSYPDAVAYVFQLSGGGLPAPVEVIKSMRTFTLNDFAGQLTPGATYTVKVRLIFNTSDPAGPFGKSCTIIAPGLSRQADTKTGVAFDATAYPNPFADNFDIGVTTDSGDSIRIRIYDMIGRMLDDKLYKAGGEILQIGARFPSGVFTVVVTQGEAVKTLQVIKR